MSDLELRQFLVAVVSLLVAAHFFGYLFQRFGLPRVVGEIVGGLLLGKTGLGLILPDAHAWLFEGFGAEGKLLSALYWIGLILLMFTSGFSLHRHQSRPERRLLAWLVIGTTVLPFMAGWLVTKGFDFTPYSGISGNSVALGLVVAIAVAVTSIPVISRIFMDLGISETPFARIVLSTAIAHDIILWAALAVATGLVGGARPDAIGITFIVAKTLLFFTISTLGGPRLLNMMTRNRYNLVRKASPVGWVLVICFLLAALASVLEVNVVFGALVAGILFGSAVEPEVDQARARITDFAFAFFVPFYFAMVGFKLNLVADFDPLFTLCFILFCTACQLLATILSARAAGKGWESALNLAVAMNARGGPGIVLATVALEYGIINGVFYATLVVLAIVTSLAAGTWFRYQLARGKTLYQ
jgi:Kef-type K+ transport system membrane component KefB